MPVTPLTAVIVANDFHPDISDSSLVLGATTLLDAWLLLRSVDRRIAAVRLLKDELANNAGLMSMLVSGIMMKAERRDSESSMIRTQLGIGKGRD